MTLILLMSSMIFYLLSTMTFWHPLTLSIKVLLLALSLCLTINFITTWYAYMIFMIMLGGVLIMFIYISSLAPNSIFKVKLNTPHMFTQMTGTTLLAYSLINFFPKAFNTQKPYLPSDSFITFFLSTSNSSLLLTLASTLFLTMFIVTNLLLNSSSAMRPMSLTFFKSSKTKK
nr:NADH dehydrogenase subunit 6 [Cuneopsis celtiformis]